MPMGAIAIDGGVLNVAPSMVDYHTLKYQNIIKQNKDYSCGAASLATILTYFYATPTSEADILTKIDGKMASFMDLAQVAEQMGFGARGLSMNYDRNGH